LSKLPTALGRAVIKNARNCTYFDCLLWLNQPAACISAVLTSKLKKALKLKDIRACNK